MNNSKIAILYIALGNYYIFWDNFIESCENYFCTDIEKEYFLFTDVPDKINTYDSKVKVFNQDNSGWPFSTLLRYHMFARLKNELQAYKYICYFNANSLFLKHINAEDFFGDSKHDLVGGLHPGYIHKSNEDYPFENRKTSTAFTENNQYYFQGCINGGRSKSFLIAIDKIKENIISDINKGIIAIWHDESHWNSYLNEKIKENSDSVKILDCNYLWPEEFNNNQNSRILMRDKNLFGGHAKLRGIKNNERLINLKLIKKAGVNIMNFLK